ADLDSNCRPAPFPVDFTPPGTSESGLARMCQGWGRGSLDEYGMELMPAPPLHSYAGRRRASMIGSARAGARRQGGPAVEAFLSAVVCVSLVDPAEMLECRSTFCSWGCSAWISRVVVRRAVDVRILRVHSS